MLQPLALATIVLAAESTPSAINGNITLENPSLSSVAVYSAPMPTSDFSIPKPNSAPAWCFRLCDNAKPAELDDAEEAVKRLLAIVSKLNNPTTEGAMRIAAEVAVIAERQRVRLAKEQK